MSPVLWTGYKQIPDHGRMHSTDRLSWWSCCRNSRWCSWGGPSWRRWTPPQQSGSPSLTSPSPGKANRPSSALSHQQDQRVWRVAMTYECMTDTHMLSYWFGSSTTCSQQHTVKFVFPFFVLSVKTSCWYSSVDAPLVGFSYLVFTYMSGLRHRRRFRSLLLGLHDVFWALINSLCLFILCFHCFENKGRKKSTWSLEIGYCFAVSV